MKYLSKQSRSYLFAVSAILFWSTVASAFKLSLEHMEPVQLVFFASIFSTLALFVILLMQKKLPLVLKLERPDLARYFFLSLLNPCLYYIILLNAYQLLPAQEAMAINYSWVIMMAILSMPILKQKVKFNTLIAIAISYLGVIVIATNGEPLSLKFTNSLGVMYALLTTVIWAIFWLFNTKEKKDSVVSLFVIFLFSIFFVSIAMIISPEHKTITLDGLIGSAYIGIFEMGVTFFLWQSALSLSSNVTKITTLAFLTPFMSLLVIYIVLGEAILLSSVFGIFLIIIGLAIQKYFMARDN
jgi:drug/metabolite transporter (DMT)-like permease